MAKKKRKKRNQKKRASITVINGQTHYLMVFRVVEVNGKLILDPMASNEQAQLKENPELNKFVTGYMTAGGIELLGMTVTSGKPE